MQAISVDRPRHTSGSPQCPTRCPGALAGVLGDTLHLACKSNQQTRSRCLWGRVSYPAHQYSLCSGSGCAVVCPKRDLKLQAGRGSSARVHVQHHKPMQACTMAGGQCQIAGQQGFSAHDAAYYIQKLTQRVAKEVTFFYSRTYSSHERKTKEAPTAFNGATSYLILCHMHGFYLPSKNAQGSTLQERGASTGLGTRAQPCASLKRRPLQ